MFTFNWFIMSPKRHFTFTGCRFGSAGPFLIIQIDIFGILDVKNGCWMLDQWNNLCISLFTVQPATPTQQEPSLTLPASTHPFLILFIPSVQPVEPTTFTIALLQPLEYCFNKSVAIHKKDLSHKLLLCHSDCSFLQCNIKLPLKCQFSGKTGSHDSRLSPDQLWKLSNFHHTLDVCSAAFQKVSKQIWTTRN